MIKSMTGYGRYEEIINNKKISCEIRSVNHRYADFNIRVPRGCGFLEEKVRQLAASRVARGKVDIYINTENYSDPEREIFLNDGMVKNYIEVLEKMRDDFNLKDDISVMSVARLPDVFRTQQREEDEEELAKAVLTVVNGAIDEFVAMRSREGERISADLCARIEYMKTIAAKVDERSPKTVEEYRTKLYTKIKEFLEDRDVDEARILTEVAIFADKVAVNEEIVRLSSHFDEFYKIISSDEPAGRRLDFLIQEINREINTTGSKANDIEIAKYVVELKGETEKLREQIQNIE